MDQKQLVFGIGSILRERTSGWATHTDGSGNDVPNVYPDHPPNDLSQSAYPRGTVDLIGHAPVGADIERNAFVGDVLMELTVYAVNSHEVAELMTDSIQAIIDYHDKDDTSGSAYLPDWSFQEIGMMNALEAVEQSEGFTRYAKSQEFQFQYVTATTLAT